MAEDTIIGIAFLVMGVTVALGMVLLRQDPVETEKLSKILPGAQLFRFKIVRIAVAIAGLCFAVLGGGLIADVWTI